MAKVKKFFEHDQWHYFVQNYLKLSELACLEMLEHKYNMLGRYNGGKIIREFTVNDLYIATIFNIKHAIEIAIKTLNGAFCDEALENNHNIKELIVVLKSKIKHINFSDNITKRFAFLEKNCDKDFQDLIIKIKKDASMINDYLNKFETLVSKYYHCEFLKDKIDNLFTIEDFDNTAFRYPDNSMSIQLNYEAITDKIKDDDILAIKSDIKDLTLAFVAMDVVLTFGKKK